MTAQETGPRNDDKWIWKKIRSKTRKQKSKSTATSEQKPQSRKQIFDQRTNFSQSTGRRILDENSIRRNEVFKPLSENFELGFCGNYANTN